MKRVKGSDLSPEDRKLVLALFVHRYTVEHLPEWVTRSAFPVPVQFKSDAEWLANTTFVLCSCGRLDLTQDCCSVPTWPYNPEWRSASQVPFQLQPHDYHEYENPDEI